MPDIVELSNKGLNTLTLWPQHLMCMRCLNGGGFLPFMELHGLQKRMERIKENPDIHVQLEAAFDEIGARTELYYHQTLQERKRDLDVLQKLGLVPGSVRTARVLYKRIEERIPTLDGICRFGLCSPESWKDCTLAKENCFEKGLTDLIHVRSTSEMREYKEDSCSKISEAGHLYIRAHHLLCIVCFVGGEHSGKPLEEDNIYEVWEKIVSCPEIPVTVVEGCSSCMICPPCDGYNPDRGICTMLCGLKDRLKDLAVFQKLGLNPGNTMSAQKLYRLIFEKIRDVEGICMFDEDTAPEWKNCATNNKGTYQKGRETGKKLLKL